MAKFHGKVGFTTTEETSPGVYEEVATERTYKGDLTRMNGSHIASEGLNPNVRINHTLSIMADKYALSHISDVRYVEWLGKHWKVTSFEVNRPRIVLYLGELYNEQQSDSVS